MPIKDDIDVFVKRYHEKCNTENPSIKYAEVLNVVRNRIKRNTLIGDISTHPLAMITLFIHFRKVMKFR